MNKPNISNDFSINDIHKIREYNTNERKRIGKKEYNDLLNKKVADFLNIDVDSIKKVKNFNVKR